LVFGRRRPQGLHEYEVMRENDHLPSAPGFLHQPTGDGDGSHLIE
jgi:hypothetical protein